MAVNPTSPKRAPTSAAKAQHSVTGAQLATAFDGKLERRRLSIGYHVGVAIVAVLMLLLPLVYFGIIAGTCWLVRYHAIHSLAMFEHLRGGRVMLFVGVIYVAPIVAGALLVLAMILPLFWRGGRRPKQYWVDRREQPLLYAYIDKLCDAMRAPRPARIAVTTEANASASIDNGLLGIFYRRLLLTLGLPFAATLSLREFTGVIAHELGHFSQGSSMRLSYAVHRINLWFATMAWGRSGIDDLLDSSMEAGESHWSLMLIVLLCKCVIGTARLVLKLMALISQALTMNLSRFAEFDADYQAARIVGSDAMARGLEKAPYVAAAFGVAVEHAQSQWQRKRLPDDLVTLTHAVHNCLPTEVKDKITAEILTSESSWFDSHPPLYKRVAALKKAKLNGVLKLHAPARVVFKDFDELNKIASIDFYQGVLGGALQPEFLVETKVQVASSPSPKPS